VIVRKSIVRVTARLRKDVHRRLVQEAKARDISINDEIERRIEDSFAIDNWRDETKNWRAERLSLLTALEFFLKNNPQSAAMREGWKSKRVDMSKVINFLEHFKEADEADQNEDLPEIMKDKPRPSKRD
jgi:hypothetical protein